MHLYPNPIPQGWVHLYPNPIPQPSVSESVECAYTPTVTYPKTHNLLLVGASEDTATDDTELKQRSRLVFVDPLQRLDIYVFLAL